jgi:hypothetical protein
LHRGFKGKRIILLEKKSGKRKDEDVSLASGKAVRHAVPLPLAYELEQFIKPEARMYSQ